MKYNKNDIINVATKLGRLVNGGVVGYYAGGKTSEVMRNIIPDELVNVVERHKKVQLGVSLAKSFIPGAGVVAKSGAGVVATSAAVASLWKMYYDINQVLGIKISDNVGKSLTSAVLTNLSSAGAKIGANAVSEGVKYIPFVGRIASAAISTVTSTAIVYGAAYLYLTALTKMYEAEGKFDLNYLTSLLEDEDYSSDYDDVAKIKKIIADVLGIGYDKVVPNASLEDLGADDLDVAEISMKLESEFGVDITDMVEKRKNVNIFSNLISIETGDEDPSLYYVKDIIEYITGESISDEEEEEEGEYEDEEIENNRITDESSYSEAEQEYLDNIREFLEDDVEITPRERKMLDRIRQKLGISEERAKELEASLAQPQLTEDEQEYLDMYREYVEKGDVTEKERRRLDKFAAAMGISNERVREIEKM